MYVGMAGLFAVGFDSELLLDEETDFRHWQFALFVVHIDGGPCVLCRSVNILLKSGPHSRLSLVDAAPGLDV